VAMSPDLPRPLGLIRLPQGANVFLQHRAKF
jgi:hypothetical protein